MHMNLWFARVIPCTIQFWEQKALIYYLFQLAYQTIKVPYQTIKVP